MFCVCKIIVLQTLSLLLSSKTPIIMNEQQFRQQIAQKLLWVGTMGRNGQKTPVEVLKQIFLTPWFGLYVLLIVAFIAFLPQLATFDLGIGAIFMVLGAVHFASQAFSQLNKLGGYCAFSQTAIHYSQQYPSKKIISLPFDTIDFYKIEPKWDDKCDLTLYKTTFLFGKETPRAEVTLQHIDKTDAWIRLLEKKIGKGEWGE